MKKIKRLSVVVLCSVLSVVTLFNYDVNANAYNVDNDPFLYVIQGGNNPDDASHGSGSGIFAIIAVAIAGAMGLTLNGVASNPALRKEIVDNVYDKMDNGDKKTFTDAVKNGDILVTDDNIQVKSGIWNWLKSKVNNAYPDMAGDVSTGSTVQMSIPIGIGSDGHAGGKKIFYEQRPLGPFQINVPIAGGHTFIFEGRTFEIKYNMTFTADRKYRYVGEHRYWLTPDSVFSAPFDIVHPSIDNYMVYSEPVYYTTYVSYTRGMKSQTEYNSNNTLNVSNLTHFNGKKMFFDEVGKRPFIYSESNDRIYLAGENQYGSVQQFVNEKFWTAQGAGVSSYMKNPNYIDKDLVDGEKVDISTGGQTVTPVITPATPVLDAEGQPVLDAEGNPVMTPASPLTTPNGQPVNVIQGDTNTVINNYTNVYPEADVAPTVTLDIPPTADIDNATNKWRVNAELLFSKFPFCLPSDVYRFITIFNAPAEPLRFSIPFSFPRLGINENMVVDLGASPTDFNTVAEIFRWFSGISWSFGLILITRKVMK